MCTWNVQGLHNLFRLDVSEQKHINIYDVIAIVESWRHCPLKSLPGYLNDYDFYETLASKDKSRGRASGGIVVLVRKSFKNVKIIDNSMD